MPDRNDRTTGKDALRHQPDDRDTDVTRQPGDKDNPDRPAPTRGRLRTEDDPDGERTRSSR